MIAKEVVHYFFLFLSRNIFKFQREKNTCILFVIGHIVKALRSLPVFFSLNKSGFSVHRHGD